MPGLFHLLFGSSWSIKILPFATAWMYLEGIKLNEISQSEKDKYHMISSHVESKEQYKHKQQKQTHGYREQTGGPQRGGGLGGLGEKGKGIRK